MSLNNWQSFYKENDSFSNYSNSTASLSTIKSKQFQKNKPQLNNPDLNNIWSYFMTAFHYKIFYKSNNISNNNDTEHKSTTIAIQKLNNFFTNNSISIQQNLNLHSSHNYLLSNPKLWIMYIVLNIKQNKPLSDIFTLFHFAIENGCELVSMFEFFLIYISRLSEKEMNYLNMNFTELVKLLPDKFIILYKERKFLLKDIFKEENEEINESNNYIVYINEIGNLNEIEDILYSEGDNKNKYDIINKDINNKGVLALLKKKQRNVFVIMPLKKKFNTYKEKEIVSEILIPLQQDEQYKEIEYMPYDEKTYILIKQSDAS